jgi:hypothetical protein
MFKFNFIEKQIVTAAHPALNASSLDKSVVIAISRNTHGSTEVPPKVNKRSRV